MSKQGMANPAVRPQPSTPAELAEVLLRVCRRAPAGPAGPFRQRLEEAWRGAEVMRLRVPESTAAAVPSAAPSLQADRSADRRFVLVLASALLGLKERDPGRLEALPDCIIRSAQPHELPMDAARALFTVPGGRQDAKPRGRTTQQESATLCPIPSQTPPR